MSAKPTTLPEWNTSGANRVTPSGGQKASGWTLGQNPPSSYFNWYQWLVYTWCLYLHDGALEGDHSIDGALDVTGPVTFDDALNVGLDIEVAGDVIATGDLRYAQQHSRHLNAAAAKAGSGITWDNGGSRWNLGTSGELVVFPLDVAVGDRIHGWNVYLQKTSVTGTITASLSKQNLLTGTFTTVGVAQTNSAVNPGHIVLGQALLAEDCAGDTAYTIIVQGGGSAGDYVKACEWNVSHP